MFVSQTTSTAIMLYKSKWNWMGKPYLIYCDNVWIGGILITISDSSCYTFNYYYRMRLVEEYSRMWNELWRYTRLQCSRSIRREVCEHVLSNNYPYNCESLNITI